MSALRKSNLLSVEDYLIYEQDSPIRHEYVHGELFAMAGASDNHNRIARNICQPLDDWLDDSPCEPFIAEMKVQVRETSFYYPDVLVACDNPALADPYIRKEPILIVEITSHSTESRDRREKLEAYQAIKTLKESLIVAQDEVSAHLYRRSRNGTWQMETFTDLSQELELKSVGLRLSLTQIYRRVKFPTKPKIELQRHPNAEGE